MSLIGLPKAQAMWADEQRIPAIKYLRYMNRDLDIRTARMELDTEYRAECEKREKYKMAVEVHDELVTALKDRILHCSCHYGGIGSGGFTDQPCDKCDRDNAILKKCGEEV